jgi:Flp pilus assembly protein TadD
MVIIMRNLSLFGCVVALIVSSGCQSGSYGFRNPFKDQFARTFPNSIPELLTKSKDSGAENRGVFDLGGEASVETSADLQSVSDSARSPESSGHSQVAEIETTLEQGDTAYAAGDLGQAAGLYHEVLALDPQNVHAHHRLAIIHDQQQDYATAEQHYEAALKLEPENPSILNDLGYSYYLQQRFEDSKAYLEYILQIKPDNQLAMRNLALVHAAEGDLQQAYALFQQGGLNPEQSQQQIQQAVARANEGKATTRSRRMGIASTNPQPAGTSSVEGVTTVERDHANDMNHTSSASIPGRAGTQSPRGHVFQPRPDLESAYGLSANQSATDPHPSARTETPGSQSFAPRPKPVDRHPALAQHEKAADHAVERVSYTPPLQQYEASAADEEMIRTALNTGYGNLFPVISPEDFYRIQRDAGVNHGADARNAYYEEFGQPESSTPHVVHADSNQPANTHISQSSLRNASYEQPRASSYGSPRIQSPSNRPDQQGPATTPVPENRFPVTESDGQGDRNPDYSRFPKQERPPFAESTGSNPASNPASQKSGTLIVPKSESASCGPYGACLAPDARTDEPDTSSVDYTPQTSPMSEEARKAHELALERYHRMQQQQ